MANEFTARNGLIAQKDSVVTGSLIVTSGITGSLSGTASYAAQALTASYASAYAAVFPYTGSAIISGSLQVTGSVLVSGSVRVGLGTSANNAIQFGSADLGMSGTSAGRLDFNTAGVSRVAILSNGTVVMGSDTTNIVGNNLLDYSTNATSIKLTPTTITLATGTGTPGTGVSYFRLHSNGNLVLQNGGTFTDAGYRLDVQGNTRLNGTAYVSGSLAVNYPSLASIYKLGVGGSAVIAGQIIVQDDSGVFAAYSSDGLTQSGGFNFNRYVGVNIYSSNANPIRFSVSGSEALRIFNGGNIGIGTTTNAGYKLDVNGTTRFNGNSIITGSINQGGTITASSTIARGTYLKPILSASANFDSLIGLDIQPNFVTSSYTQISPVGLRVTNPGGGIITIGQNKDFSFVNEILCTGRLDFGSTTSQLFMRGTQIYFSGPTVLTRTADASSTATQRSSYSFPMQAALWNGSAQSLIQSGFAHKASTTVNLASRLAAIVNTTGTDLNTSGTEALTIFSPSANVLLAASGSTTFTDAGYRLDVVGTSRFNGNMNITGSQTSLYYNYISNPNAVATAAARLYLVNAAGNSATLTITSNSDAVDPSLMMFGGSNKGVEIVSNSVRAFRIFDATRNAIIQNGGTFTDAGYRLDVQGTTRFNGNSLITGSLGILNGNLTLNTSSAAPAASFRDSPSILTYGSIWNSAIGPVAMNGGFKITPNTSPAGANTNPTIAKLSFLVGTDNSGSTEQMYISSQGKFGINGGALFSAPSSSNTYNITMTTGLAASPSLAANSNKLILKGNAWNNTQGNVPNMGYLRMINVTNNSNPTVDKLSFFVGSANFVNDGDVDGNAIERFSIRTDGIIISSGSLIVTGSLNVTSGITGSLLGTASYATQALSASYAPSTPTFPYTGSATISGSLSVTGTTIAGFNPTPRTGSIRDGVTSVLGDLQDWNDKYYSGEVLYNEVAAETIAFGQLVTRSGGGWYLANATDTSFSTSMLGICLYPASENGSTSILINGFVSIDTAYVNEFKMGLPMFMSAATAGNIDTDAPTTAGNVVRIVGYTFWDTTSQANGKYILRFTPDNTWIEL